jgi:hypothetical protein
VVNYLLGKRQSGWVTNVPRFASVTYQGVYPHIDLHFRRGPSGVEYDWLLYPGADPGRIRMAAEGGRLTLEANGDLSMRSHGIRVLQAAPRIFQVIAGARRLVPGEFVVHGSTAGIVVGAYDRRHELVIDPALRFSTYLGGPEFDDAKAVATDSGGNTYVGGGAEGAGLPLVNAVQGTYFGMESAFIAKYDSAGAPVFVTYLNGTSGSTEVHGIAADAAGEAYVTGATGAPDFPAVQAIQHSNAGGYDAFVTKLTASGSALVYSTYLGGSQNDDGDGIAVDGSEAAYVVGQTESANFPTRIAAQPTPGDAKSLGDAFAAKLSPDGQTLAYSTYLGGSAADGAASVAVDGSGVAYLGGYTRSLDFHTANSLPGQAAGHGGMCGSPTPSPCYDGFVVKLDAGGAIAFSTILGGSAGDGVDSLGLADTGNLWIAGDSTSTDFPLMRAYQSVNKGNDDATLTEISPSDTLLYSTFLGGTGEDYPAGVSARGGLVAMAGVTDSSDFPIADPLTGGAKIDRGSCAPSTTPCPYDGFVSLIDPGPNSLISTYLGGSAKDFVEGLAQDNLLDLHVVGFTSSTDFPVDAAQPVFGGGGGDAFVARITGLTASTTPTATATTTATLAPSATPSPSPSPTATSTPTPPTKRCAGKHVVLKKGRCACTKGYHMHKGKCVKTKHKKKPTRMEL